MTTRDASGTLRTVSSLRSLCLRLPHLPTPEELTVLQRFDFLAADPSSATHKDVASLVAGWRRWWRDGAYGELSSMACQLPARIVEDDRRLAALRTAATFLNWPQIQDSIFKCDTCRVDPRVSTSAKARVAINVRQQTDRPVSPLVGLLVVTLAPPFMEASQRIVAKSATNNADDNIRHFVESTLGRTWADLTANGFALAHAVKCAITPVDQHQNPPPDVVDVCAPQHLARELQALRPRVVLTLGDMAYRALVRSLPLTQDHPIDLRLIKKPSRALPGQEGHVVRLSDHWLTLFTSRFPTGDGIHEAATALRKAAKVAGVSAGI